MHKQPESIAHGDAWKYFCISMGKRQYGEEETRDAWLWFLEGWLSKAKQVDSFRNKRYGN